MVFYEGAAEGSASQIRFPCMLSSSKCVLHGRRDKYREHQFLITFGKRVARHFFVAGPLSQTRVVGGGE
jgi:hypothetical protein